MPVVIHVQTVRTEDSKAYIERLTENLKNADPTKAIEHMASVWGKNFDTEGGSVGGWPPLSPMTQQDRARMGYGPEHPILERTGSLRQATVDDLLTGDLTEGTKLYMASYEGRGAPTVTTFSYSRPEEGVAVLTVSGPAASNQYRDDSRSVSTVQVGKRSTNNFASGGRPARPYWFVDAEVNWAARTGVSEWVTEMIGNLQ